MTDQPSQRRFLTVEQAAEELNVKSSLIRGLISSGELRAIQVGKIRGACGASASRIWKTTSPKRTGAQPHTLPLAISWMTRSLGLSSRQRAVRTARRDRTSPCESACWPMTVVTRKRRLRTRINPGRAAVLQSESCPGDTWHLRQLSSPPSARSNPPRPRLPPGPHSPYSRSG